MNMARASKVAKTDIQTLLDDAQVMFKEAASLTGDKADELRLKAQELLEDALEKAHTLQAAAVEKGKEAAVTADTYVRDNPWRAVAISAGVGIVAGLLLGRRK
jgi:ElaB/YqjD/DUF883 family membrane-anchored ribosome-binding protein